MAVAELAQQKQSTGAAQDRPAFKVRDLALADSGRKEVRLA